ncbi:MAG: hypothetical protein HPY61_12755 [Methanotrichaceae archaeon]|nr:hypothetical protein [Methanotrichaceae archaeon]
MRLRDDAGLCGSSRNHALLGSGDLFIQALKRSPDLQEVQSAVCHRQLLHGFHPLEPQFWGLEIRRGSTVFQLMTILKEARISLILPWARKSSGFTPC